MKKYVKKVYLSIMLVVFSLLTMVATTYAWVGLLTSTTFEQFVVNLEKNGENFEYGIQLSLDGVNFYENEIPAIDLQRVLLENNGHSVSGLNDNRVGEMYRQNRIRQCTTWRKFGNDNRLTDFTLPSGKVVHFVDMEDQPTNDYYWFDLYVSVYKIGDVDASDSNIKLEIYLRNSILSSTESAGVAKTYPYYLVNPITYPNVNPVNQAILGNAGGIPLGATIGGNINVDPATACRVAIEKYAAVDIGKVEQYDQIPNVNTGIYIFQSGSKTPVYDQLTNTYDFGGILPPDYNFARLYYNSTHNDNQLGNIRTEILGRGDVQFKDDGTTNKIITQADGITLQKMARFRIYFWYEGWDSNCFEAIDNKQVFVNLSFSTKNPNDN